MLFLDSELRIEFFTPNASRLFSIISSDIGRPVSSFTRKFADPALLPDASAVLQSGAPMRREIAAEDGTWYLRQVLPYRGEHDRGRGVIITFTDIHEIKTAEQRLEATKSYLESIVDTVRGPLLVLDSDPRVVSASRSFYRQFNIEAAPTEGRYVFDLADGQWDNPTLRDLLKEIPAGQTTVESFELELHDGDGVRRTMLLDACRLPDSGSERAPMILLAMEDITERRRAVEEQFQAFLDVSPDPTVGVDSTGVIKFVNEQIAKLFGHPRAALIGH